MQRSLAERIAALVYCNPFTAQRIDLERKALGRRFSGSRGVWDVSTHGQGGQANLAALSSLVGSLCESLRRRLAGGARPRDEAEAQLYEDLTLYLLFDRHHAALESHVRNTSDPSAGKTYAAFAADYQRQLGPLKHEAAGAAHAFACCFQLCRAFEAIFHTIVGTSPAVATLRAAVWRSIFTHDLRRYARSLYTRMADVPTLVLGPSGTGKELVARAIACSGFVPFDAKRGTFAGDLSASFLPLSLAALPETLVESELFGHRRGAFTGAAVDRVGRLEACPAFGTVFLDEVGELSPLVQVKLLRVLQERTFERIGESRPRRFAGKIVAATNRDIADEMSPFRRDLYYRLCADLIETPSLREQLDDAPPGEMQRLVHAISKRIAPGDADALTHDTLATIARHLPPDHPWPGNFRELEQLVRNVLVRGIEHPLTPRRAIRVARSPQTWLDQAHAGTLTAGELLDAYCAHVYEREGTYERAGERLGLDRRTVRASVARAQKSPASHRSTQ